MSNLKPYKERIISTLYDKEYEVESKKNPGQFYPSNRVTVDLLSYEGETKYGPYQGEKIKITNQKRTLERGEVVNSKKVNNYGGVSDDLSVVSLSISEFTEMLNSQKDILSELENSDK